MILQLPRKRAFCLALVVSLAAGALSASAEPDADPSPASKPADVPALTERNSEQYTSESLGVRFRVPKAWERTKTSGGAAMEQTWFIFDPNPGQTRARRNGPARPAAQPKVALMLGRPCFAGEPLADHAAETRTGVVQHHPGVALTSDEAVDLAGRPAWRFAWTETKDVPLTTTRNGKTTVRQVPVTTRYERVIWLENGVSYTLAFETGEPAFDRLKEAVDGVLASLVWAKPE